MKILSIGNSFSQDAQAYLKNIADAGGVELMAVNLYIGGCSLERHYDNIKGDIADYDYELNGVKTERKATIKEVLSEHKWDYITFQQVSRLSFDYSTYQPYLAEISKLAKELAPDAEQVIHQTWSYEEGSEKLTEQLGFSTQREMFDKLKAAYESAARDLGGVRIIPCGETFQRALAGGMKQVHRDTYHALIPQGRYMLAATWFEFFTGKSVIGNTYCPEDMDKAELEALQKYAHIL